MKYLIYIVMLVSACAFAAPCNNADNYYTGNVSCQIGMTKDNNLYNKLVYQPSGNNVHMNFHAGKKVNLLVDYDVVDNGSNHYNHFEKVLSLPKDNSFDIRLDKNQHFANAVIVKYQNNNNKLSPKFEYHNVSIDID